MKKSLGLTAFRALSSRWLGLEAGQAGAKRLVLTTLAAFVVLGIWAAQSDVDQLVRARGQVIPVARTQIIQAADNGVIKMVFVREGQTVRQGQLLAAFDDSRARAAYDDSRNKVAALKAALARLNAEALGGNLVFSKELDAWPAFLQNQSELFARRRQALNEGVSALQSSRMLAAQELAITEPLLATGDVGKVEVIRLRRAVADLDGQIAAMRNRFFQEVQAEMTKAEEDLATQEELLREREAVLAFSKLRAPVDGLVNKVNFTTPGASVRQGDPVMELLPTSSELIVEAKYPPSDVASLKLG